MTLSQALIVSKIESGCHLCGGFFKALCVGSYKRIKQRVVLASLFGFVVVVFVMEEGRALVSTSTY